MVKELIQYDCPRYSGLLFLVTLVYFFSNGQKQKPVIEYFLAFLLVVSVVFTQIFWRKPVKNSEIHKADALIAKCSAVVFIFYTLAYKFRYSYLLVILASAISWYYSNVYSKLRWCSDQHLFWHSMFHFWCFVGSIYAFIPVTRPKK